MTESQREKWEVLLSSWRSDVLQVWEANREKWLVLGLPDVDELKRTPVDVTAVDRLQADWGSTIDPEVLLFYKTTNEWPLWLGSFWSCMLPANQVDLFYRIYPDAFSMAEDSAGESQVMDGSSTELSKAELATALVLTQPDARELVLSLRSGETCLYFFDGMRIFSDFYAFMTHRRREVREWLLDMLGK